MPRPNRESKRPAAGPGVVRTPDKSTANGASGKAASEVDRKGAVRMRVPLGHSVAVIEITSYTKGGTVKKNYLLRVVGAMKFALSPFKDEEKDKDPDGATTYVVHLGDTPYCGCEDWRRNHNECKHMLALRELVSRGKV